MLGLKKQVFRYIIILTAGLIALILLSGLVVQLLTSRSNMVKTSNTIFDQIKNVLESNQEQLLITQEEFQEKSYEKADAIASMVDHSPDFATVLESMTSKIKSLHKNRGNYTPVNAEIGLYERLKNILNLVEIDEISFLYPYTGEDDQNNAIILASTNLERVGYTLTDEGAKLSYFKRMIDYEKVTRLYQDIPTGVNDDTMHYSAVWSLNKQYMILVGSTPSTMQKILRNYELSHIFSLFRTGDDVLYAIDESTGVLLGSTNTADIDEGKNYKDIGLSDITSHIEDDVFTVFVDGEEYLCCMSEINGNYIARMMSKSTVYKDFLLNELLLFLGVSTVAGIVIFAGILYIDRYVIRSIHKINDSLRGITQGDLDENINIRNCLEFSELSDHINAMVSSLLSSTDVISYVLDKSDLHTCVYEYNASMKRVRYTVNLPAILHLDEKSIQTLVGDSALFKSYISGICKNRIDSDNESGIYCLVDNSEGKNEHVYLKIEETEHNNGVVGVVVDVTETVLERRKIEKERDVDVLTGLYNRRGFERRMDALFKNYRELGYGVLIMFDADGLKIVNDRYGHDNGDLYLNAMSDVIKSFSNDYTVSGRIGGDEFIMFMYNLDGTEEIDRIIKTLNEKQNNTIVKMSDGAEVQLCFSYGHIPSKGYSDYRVLEKVADGLMYKNKRLRKEQQKTSK